MFLIISIRFAPNFSFLATYMQYISRFYCILNLNLVDASSRLALSYSFHHQWGCYSLLSFKMVRTADQKPRTLLYTMIPRAHLQWRCWWWSVQLGMSYQHQSTSQKAWKRKLTSSKVQATNHQFFASKFTQQSATLNTPPPAHATSLSQKSSDTIIINDDVDLKDTPSV